jgi:hypothetical protein
MFSMLALQEVLGQLEVLEEAQREYIACMQTTASVAAVAHHAALGAERSLQPAHVPEAWQDRCGSFRYQRADQS